MCLLARPTPCDPIHHIRGPENDLVVLPAVLKSQKGKIFRLIRLKLHQSPFCPSLNCIEMTTVHNFVNAFIS